MGSRIGKVGFSLSAAPFIASVHFCSYEILVSHVFLFMYHEVSAMGSVLWFKWSYQLVAYSTECWDKFKGPSKGNFILWKERHTASFF